MGKIIEITNCPDFNKGVVTYVVECDHRVTRYATAPNKSKAKVFNESDPDFKLNLEFIKDDFKTSTITLIDK